LGGREGRERETLTKVGKNVNLQNLRRIRWLCKTSKVVSVSGCKNLFADIITTVLTRADGGWKMRERREGSVCGWGNYR